MLKKGKEVEEEGIVILQYYSMMYYEDEKVRLSLLAYLKQAIFKKHA